MIPQTSRQDVPDLDNAEQPIPRLAAQQRISLLLLLLCIAGIFEVCYILLFALSPLPGLHLTNTPLATAWQWTLLPSQLLQNILRTLFTAPTAWLAPILLASVLAVLISVYISSMFVLHRIPELQATTGRWLILLVGGALLFGLTQLFQPWLFSDDVWTHIFSGRLLAIHGANPLSTPPDQFASDPFFRWVLSTRDKPNIFGPLWIYMAALLAKISDDPGTSLLVFKTTALLTHLLCCGLVWRILGLIAPQRRFIGTFLYAWNPLMLIELAGNGHNEGVLLCLLLLATWLYIEGEQSAKQERAALYKTGAFLIFGLAVSTNLITLLLVPLLLWFDLRSQPHMPRIVLGLALRGLLILAPALLIVLPLWRGATTFLALTSAVDMEHFVHAPVGLLAMPLHALFDFAQEGWHLPVSIPPDTAADIALRASASFIFALIYLHLFSRLRSSGQSQPTSEALLSSWGIAVFWYMVLVSGWFWPWYLLWLLWVIILQRLDAFTSAMLVLSCTALFIYPFTGFSKTPMEPYQSALIFGIPLCYLIGAKIWQTYQERAGVSS